MNRRRILITGGAGFVGCNLADRFIAAGHDVTVFDNFFRKGVRHNLTWLRRRYEEGFRFVEGDIRDYAVIRRVAEGAQVVYHAAGQTAVTTSVANPRLDFEINAAGTLNVLEAAREVGDNPVVVFTSSNKVYGALEELRIEEHEMRYALADRPFGIDERQALDFHSPYGCSNGAADQYVRDYARIYGLPTVVFRMGSVYGPRQFGAEDQAWVAYFIIAAVKNQPLTIYGDGKQVRDLLYIDDLVAAFELATEHSEITRGQVYNIGGGPANIVSVWAEFSAILRDIVGKPVTLARHAAWRPGDQRVYVSDTRKAQRDFGWQPRVGVSEGVGRLTQWVLENRELF